MKLQFFSFAILLVIGTVSAAVIHLDPLYFDQQTGCVVYADENNNSCTFNASDPYLIYEFEIPPVNGFLTSTFEMGKNFILKPCYPTKTDASINNLSLTYLAYRTKSNSPPALSDVINTSGNNYINVSNDSRGISLFRICIYSPLIEIGGVNVSEIAPGKFSVEGVVRNIGDVDANNVAVEMEDASYTEVIPLSYSFYLANANSPRSEREKKFIFRVVPVSALGSITAKYSSISGKEITIKHKINSDEINRSIVEDECKSDKDCAFGHCYLGKCSIEAFSKFPMKIALIFDNSGSMSGEKIQRAKNASKQFIRSIKNPNTQFSLYIFDGCRPFKKVNFTTDRNFVIQQINELSAISSTPLGGTLQRVYDDLANESGYRAVVLFTDGGESCRINPCDVIKRHKEKYPVYTIGYLVDEDVKEQLECVSRVSNGKFISSPTIETLPEVFQETLDRMEGICRDNEDCYSDEVCLKGKCTAAKFHIVFFGINNMDKEELKKVVDRQMSFFLKSIPSLENCTDRVRVTISNRNCKMIESQLDNSSYTYKRLDMCILRMKGHKRNSYDFIVGVIPSSLGVVTGYTHINDTHIIITPVSDIVLAHELSHDFGLYDEYCSCPGLCNEEPNPLKKEYGCDPNGDCCWKDFEILGYEIFGNKCDLGDYEKRGCKVCCNGNRNKYGGISIMSYVNAKGPRYHDDISLKYLEKIDKLRCE